MHDLDIAIALCNYLLAYLALRTIMVRFLA